MRSVTRFYFLAIAFWIEIPSASHAQTAINSQNKGGDVVQLAQTFPGQKNQPPSEVSRLGASKAPVPSGGSSSEAWTASRPPQRFTGIQGVNLGMRIKEAETMLLSNGWEGAGSDSVKKEFRKRPGMFISVLQCCPDPSGAFIVEGIVFTQSYKPGEGRFETEKLREQIIAKYGTPFQELGDASRHQFSLQFKESPLNSVAALQRAPTAQRNEHNLAPSLLVNLSEQSISFQFLWHALQRDASRRFSENQQTIQKGAPTKGIDFGGGVSK